MPASLHEWAHQLEHQPLPAMAYSVQRIALMMARPSSSNADYRHIVARDAGFALSIFRHLSRLPKPPREPITSLSHALALTGTAPLEAGVKNLPVIESAADIDHNRGLLACYSRAAHAAAYISHWGEIRKDSNPEELMLAVLLHDCGEMAMWCAAPAQMAAVEAHLAQGMQRESASLAVFGFTLPQLSQELVNAWKLPSLIGDSLAPDGAFRARSLGVMLACELARCSADTWDSAQTMELIELAAEYCRQTSDQAAAALHSLSAHSARQLQGLNLPLSACELIQLQPGSKETLASGTAHVESAAKPESVQTPRTTATDAPVSAAHSVPLRPVNEAQPSSGPQLALRPDTATPQAADTPPPVQRPTGGSLQLLLAGVMKQLRDNAGLERSMFAMLSPDRKSLRARFIIGAEKATAIKTFQVGLDKPNLFSLVLSKPQSFWLNSGNHKKYLPMIPLHLHSALNTHGFFVSSLYVDEIPVGILYADSHTGRNLNNGSFTYFKQLTQQLSGDLSNTGKVSATG